MQRREFLKNISLATVLLADGSILSATAADAFARKPVIRFAIASDGHYGQAKTDFEKYFETAVNQINLQHKLGKLDLCIFNGDVIHDNPDFLPASKKALDNLQMPYYVTQGNHDRVPEELWIKTWNMQMDYDVVVGKNAFLFGTTSNIRGEYLCPNVSWFRNKLDEHKDKKNVFIFVHITPVKWTENGKDCVEFQELLTQYKNVRGVFNGHDHDQEGVKMVYRICSTHISVEAGVQPIVDSELLN